ncbi:hypothetical protein AB0G76_18685 [Streptomyces asoensis]|uniref:hypothetical protein n=1 Tax=Streptomyces asoensis TaxID=249586 RepID=UPI003401612E
MAELPEIVDQHILEGRTILAVKTIRDAQECPLDEAIHLYHQRYEELHPEPDTAQKCPGPRILRFEADGSLTVSEDQQDVR